MYTYVYVPVVMDFPLKQTRAVVVGGVSILHGFTAAKWQCMWEISNLGFVQWYVYRTF